VVVNNQPGDPIAMGQDGTPAQPTITGVMVALGDRAAVQADAGQSATFDPSNAMEFITSNQDVIAAFSSVGPVDHDYSVKPDITGVGVNVYSSVPGKPEGQFLMLQGTSMATPHTAGAAALIIQQHPTWTPDQVKSALVTTGQRVVKTLPPPAAAVDPGVLHRGGGLIDLANAGSVTVTVSSPLVGFGHQEANGQVKKSQSIIFTDVSGVAHTYDVTVSQAASSKVTFGVSKGSLTVPANGSATLDVTLTSSGVTPGDFEGDLVVAGSGPTLRIPLWVRFK
jgi:minor extracellular serine protease Vpr